MDLEALLAHARALVGVELGELADALGLPVPVGRVRTKGWSGQVIEHELGVAIGGARGPDFAALGIELKTVPVTPALVPLESTAVCQIDPIAIAGESWDTSYVRAKLARVLFVALEVPPGARSVGERRVAAVRLWSPGARRGGARCAPTSSCSCATISAAGAPPRSPATSAPCCRCAPRGATPPTCATPTTPTAARRASARCGFYLRPAFVARILRARRDRRDRASRRLCSRAMRVWRIMTTAT